jgi:hypothetical protein
MLSFQQGKIRRAFKKCYDFIFQTFQNCVTWYCLSWGTSVYRIYTYRDMDVIWEIKALNI